MSECKLRPHHGMCMAFFRGKGYSEAFIQHMTEILTLLDQEKPIVQLTVGGDSICSCCPNLQEGVCRCGDHVERYDRAVLELCGLSDGQRLPAQEFRRLVQENILNAGRREEICGGCQWNSLCQQ